MLVLADLGDGPSLADALLGADPAVAEAALGDWAETLGRLQAASADRGDAFATGLGSLPPDTSADALASAAEALAPLLPQLGVRPSAAALDELRGLRVGGPTALTPGDACPDNNVLTQDGYVLIDFEWAEFRPVAWDAAYLRVPWPTCWCSWALPGEVVERALDRWRAVIGPLPPDFDAELDRATLAWAFISTGFFLPRILDGTDRRAEPRRPGPPRVPAPPAQHRTRRRPAGRPRRRDPRRPRSGTQDAHPLALAPAFR